MLFAEVWVAVSVHYEIARGVRKRGQQRDPKPPPRLRKVALDAPRASFSVGTAFRAPALKEGMAMLRPID